jgi:hypothetical protein
VLHFATLICRRPPVVRTQSNSIIDHLSKQPTPAPTERDLNDDYPDIFDEPDPVASFLVTPEATPAKNWNVNVKNNKVGFFFQLLRSQN